MIRDNFDTDFYRTTRYQGNNKQNEQLVHERAVETWRQSFGRFGYLSQVNKKQLEELLPVVLSRLKDNMIKGIKRALTAATPTVTVVVAHEQEPEQEEDLFTLNQQQEDVFNTSNNSLIHLLDENNRGAPTDDLDALFSEFDFPPPPPPTESSVQNEIERLREETERLNTALTEERHETERLNIAWTQEKNQWYDETQRLNDCLDEFRREKIVFDERLKLLEETGQRRIQDMQSELMESKKQYLDTQHALKQWKKTMAQKEHIEKTLFRMSDEVDYDAETIILDEDVVGEKRKRNDDDDDDTSSECSHMSKKPRHVIAVSLMNKLAFEKLVAHHDSEKFQKKIESLYAELAGSDKFLTKVRKSFVKAEEKTGNDGVREQAKVMRLFIEALMTV